MRATRRHAADAAAADLSNAFIRWHDYAGPNTSADISKVVDWLHGISAGEQAAARAEHRAAADAAKKAEATPIAKRNRAARAARQPGKVSIRQRLGTEPHAAYPLPDPKVPSDALAAANLADLNARNVTDALLAEWASSPNAEIRDIAAAEFTRRASLPAIGDDPAIVAKPPTKRAARARGAA